MLTRRAGLKATALTARGYSRVPCLLAAAAVRTGKVYYFDWSSKKAKEV